jgi:hypothetical protein
MGFNDWLRNCDGFSPDFMSEFFFYADFKAKTFTWTTSQRHEFTFNVSDLHTGKVTKHSCLRRGYRINNVFAIKWSSKIAYLFELNGLNNRNYCHIIDLASQFTFCRRLQFFGSKQPIGVSYIACTFLYFEKRWFRIPLTNNTWSHRSLAMWIAILIKTTIYNDGIINICSMERSILVA